MPTNLRRLLAQAANADPLNTADADAQQMIADGIVIRRSKICPVKRKPVKAAYNTKTEEFYYNADGSAMTLREWRAMHGVQPKKQKQRSDAGLRQVIQPGDAIHCRRAEIEQWLNK
ncbi:TPA: ATP-dependent DNA helicase RecQ, partial [Escherichia coli]|nr:ATP-dependent DNA helicase RecQ [Escherichia coli]